MFICKWCTNEYESYTSLAKHTSRTHKIDKETLRIAYFHNGVRPICACGCDQPTKLHAGGFMTYLNGHNSKIANGMTGKTHTDAAKASISTKRKAKFASGELVMWSAGLSVKTDAKIQAMAQKISDNTERAQKISIALTGKIHSEEHRLNNNAAVKKAWADPILRQKQADNRIKYFTSGQCKSVSGLEHKFKQILVDKGVAFQQQFYAKDICAYYDFCIYRPDGSYFLVEIHGDFWHCNPNTKHKFPKYEAQLKNIKNDEKKRLWCILNNIPLVVIWESDIDRALDIIEEELEKVTEK